MTDATTLDAVGRTLQVGDTAGGSIEPDITLFGTVVAIDGDEVIIDTTLPEKAGAGPALAASAEKVFRLGRPVLLDVPFTAECGPALFHIGQDNPSGILAPDPGTYTITRIDLAAPTDQHDRDLCVALIDAARHIVSAGTRRSLDTAGRPALVYAGSDGTTLTRIDTNCLDDPRETHLCLALLRRARTLCEEPLPTRADEAGRILS